MLIKEVFFLAIMDIKDFPVTQLLGSSVLFEACMNGGKTESLILELKRAHYYGLNSIAYNHERNIRERNAIVVDGKEHYPARTVGSIAELRQDFEMRRKILQSRQFAYKGVDEIIEIEGIPHVKGLPLSVWGADEINLFCLTEQEAKETVEFILWSKQQELAGYNSGLLYDFRQREFKYVHAILPYIDIRQEKKPACMALDAEARKCTNTAKHTQRVWSIEFVKETGLEALLGEMEIVDFMDKDKKKSINQYVAAPFFDQTLRIEEEKNKKVKYLPVCTSCAVLPYKEETFQVYDALKESRDIHVLNNPLLVKAIVDFLESEKWVKRDGDQLIAVPHYKNRIGSFSAQ